MVNFVVGKNADQRDFLIHKEIAHLYSPYFKAAFESEMREGETQTIILDDVESRVFDSLVRWLYTQDLDRCHTGFGDDLKIEPTKLWLLADRFLKSALQNTVMMYMLSETSHDPKSSLEDFMDFAYDESDSPVLCKLASQTAPLRLTSMEWAVKSQQIIIKGLERTHIVRINIW